MATITPRAPARKIGSEEAACSSGRTLGVLAEADFFSVAVLTWQGLVTFHIAAACLLR